MKFEIDYLNEAETFLNKELNESTRLKFAKVLRKVQEGHNTAKDFKKLDGTDGLYEFRVTDNGSWYRMLAFKVQFEGDVCPTLVATHGFKKKKNKIPQSEIDKAEKLKKNY